MDVIHYAPFRSLKYIHVSIDTFAGAIFASAPMGEKSKDVIKHYHLAFSALGVPEALKMDDGLAYSSKHFKIFLDQWEIKHTTGIPHNPTGQAIVERTHCNTKWVLDQQ